MELIIKGFIIGIGKILPGISGSMLAISLGIYEELIEKIANIKKDIIGNIKYLIKPSIGIVLAIILTSKIIVNCLNEYYFATILLFTGLIAGSIPKLIKNTKIKKKHLIIIISIIIITIMIENQNLSKKNEIEYTMEEFIKLAGIGILDAASSIIPGISGTMLLMALGYYNIVLETFASSSDINKIQENSFILIPFISGFITGIIIISKIINKTLKKYKNIANEIIIILMSSSIIALLKETILKSKNNTETALGIILFIIGIIISIRIENKNTNKYNKYNKMR